MVKPPRDQSTILVKWVKAPPAGISTIGELKTKVKIVKVPKLWTVDQTIAFYLSLPGVAYAEPNYVAAQHGLAAPNDPYFNDQWGLAKIDALAGWEIYSGSYGAAGAPIAIVDSGIDGTHPDLAGQVAPGANCTTGVCVAGLSIDDNGHGTVNAGAAAAAMNNSRGVAGVAHGARLLPVKVLGATGTGTYAGIAAGIIWAADNGARVINLSLGGTADSRTLCDAVIYALDRGVFVDAASGNLGVADPIYPAACSGVVGVGATDQNDAVPAWSDTGSPNVFVSAPGVSIHATYPGDRYALATGTSVSAALVSGLASLLLAQDPTRTPAELRRILATTSDKVGSASDYGADPYHTCGGCTWSATAGYGRINVFRALSATPTQAGPAQDPAPAAPPSSSPSSSSSPPAAPPAPTADFAVAAASASASAVQGADATYTLSIAGQDGFDGTVSLAVSGLPAGATAAFAPASVPVSGSSTLTVSVANETPAGSYTLTVRGTSGSLVHTASLTLVVKASAPPPATESDFKLSATPGARIVKPGKPGLITVKPVGPSGPVAGVQLSVSGLPAGVTASFQALSSGVWTLKLEAAPTARRFQTVTVTITGRLGSIVRTTTVVIVVL